MPKSPEKHMHPIDKFIHESDILKLLKEADIQYLTSIQVQAIESNLFFHQNLLVCTPSGSGKTLIAILAIAKLLLNYHANALYLVPYKSLAQEKQNQLNLFFRNTSIKAHAITSDTSDSIAIFDDYKIIVTTYEKCDSLLRTNHPFLSKAKCIIIDEIHELGFSNRGGYLEFLLVRLFQKLQMVQIVALSATIGNIVELRDWLSQISRDFELIFTKERPIPLNYRLSTVTNKISAIRNICKDNLRNNGQIILFVNKRKDCYKIGQKLTKTVAKHLDLNEKEKLIELQHILKLNHSLSPFLTELVVHGIGYHNASLSFKERSLIETNFRNKNLKVLVATTTLAAGINLPARVVIVYDILKYQKHWNVQSEDFRKTGIRISSSGKGVIFPLNPNMMFQMLGRAGRLGFDDSGESYILLRNKEEFEFAKNFYFHSKYAKKHQPNLKEKEIFVNLKPKYSMVRSQLQKSELLQELILLLIYSIPGISFNQIKEFISMTFYAYQHIKGSKLHLEEQLSKDLLLVKYNLMDIIEKYSNETEKRKMKSILTDIQIDFTKINQNQIHATLRYNHHRYHISFNRQYGISCSCNPNYIWKDYSLSYENREFHPFCTHILKILYYIDENGTSTTKKFVEQMINSILKHLFIIPTLIEKGFIKKNIQNNTLYATYLGRLTCQLFISPLNVEYILKILQNFIDFSEKSLLEPIVDFYCKNNNKFPKDIQSVLISWIFEHTMEDILDHYPDFGVGDIFHIKSEIERIISIFAALSSYLIGKTKIYVNYFTELSRCFHLLSLRIKHGVKQDLLQLMETFPKLSRNRARILAESGYNTVQKILTSNVDEISQDTHISVIQLRKIIEYIIPLEKKWQTINNSYPKAQLEH